MCAGLQWTHARLEFASVKSALVSSYINIFQIRKRRTRAIVRMGRRRCLRGRRKSKRGVKMPAGSDSLLIHVQFLRSTRVEREGNMDKCSPLCKWTPMRKRSMVREKETGRERTYSKGQMESNCQALAPVGGQKRWSALL